MEYPSLNQKVVVIGHKNPDTDSICSAIAYADLKNKLGELECEPRRAGNLNQETAYVLKRFHVPVPRLCTDVYPKVRNVSYRRIDALSPSTSIRTAWGIMRDQQIDTLAVTDAENNLTGVVTVKSIAMANMDVFDTEVLSKSHTSYQNILSTLNGTMAVGDENDSVQDGARVIVAAASPDLLEDTMQEGDIVITSNRYETQLCAIEMGASLMIICQGARIGKTIVKLAEENHVAIMSVPYDSYAVAKLISQCAPISSCISNEDLITFTLFSPIDDVINVVSKVRHRYFPILDRDGKYCGLLSRRNIISFRKRQMILVDHNETTQAVDGYDQAEILEIIDHHRIGNLETTGPVYFRNMPVGCTATIITSMYDENGVEIGPETAGLLLSAILSDTLKFASPTCTPLDRSVASRLAKIAGVDIDTYANEMFEAGERLDGKTPEDVMMQDFKIFMCGDTRFGVSQNFFLTRNNLEAAKELLIPYLQEALVRQNLEDLYVVLTDIQNSSSLVLCTGQQADHVLETAFAQEKENGDTEGLWVDGLVSRKKQFIPKVMEAYQK